MIYFAPDGVETSLVVALFEYIDLLLEFNRYYIFGPGKFTFHLPPKADCAIPTDGGIRAWPCKGKS